MMYEADNAGGNFLMTEFSDLDQRIKNWLKED